MKAAVMTEVGNIEMKEMTIPVPKDNEVLVKIECVGICGSDLHYYEHGRIGDFIVDKPIILGHESAGKIIEVGKNVKGLAVGDVVSIEPGVPCGKCEFCKTGRYNLCPDVVFMATPPYDGAFVEYVAYPADMVYKLPEGVGALEGALIEPLAVGFHAANQAQAKIGQSAVILGAGCIGLVTMMVLKSMGISQVYVVDIISKRLTKASELGATKVFKADEVDVVKEIMELTNGEGVDLVFETAGSKITTQLTAQLVKRGGNITLVGMAADAIIPYDFGTLLGKEARITTVFRYKNIYPTAIKAVAAGIIPLKEIVSHTFSFDDVQEGIEYNIKNKADVIKAVIELK